MGMDHYYTFFDRPAVDAVLGLRWTEFLGRYPVRHRRDDLGDTLEGDIKEFLTFAVDPEPDAAEVAKMISTKSLRWTVKRSSPQYWVIGEIITHVDRLARKCPTVWLADDSAADLFGLLFTAIGGYIDRRLDPKTLWAVHNITGCDDLTGKMTLTRRQVSEVRSVFAAGGVQRPAFHWQSPTCLEEGFTCLRPADTRRFIEFLRRAWIEDWELRHVDGEMAASIAGMADGNLRFRKLDAARELVVGVRRLRAAEPCVIRHFG